MECQRWVSSREFAEWMAYFRRHPWDEDRMDIRFSILLAHLANLQRDEKKRPRPYSWKDFKIQFGETSVEPEEEDVKPWQHLMARARSWLIASGGVDKRSKK